MRILIRLAIWGLAAFGAKVLYDRYESSVPKVKEAGRSAADRVGRASDRVKRQAKGAAKDVAGHARTASQEISDAASDVVELSQPAAPDGSQRVTHDS
ncbi:MAG: hypothetical protein ACXVES_13890 [Actinomycetota bacterium]